MNVSKGIAFLQGQTSVVVYNVSGIHWLTAQSEVGKFLAGIFGWDPRPSVEQVGVYLLYMVPVLVLFFWDRSRPRPAPAPAPQPAEAEAAAG